MSKMLIIENRLEKTIKRCCINHFLKERGSNKVPAKGGQALVLF